MMGAVFPTALPHGRTARRLTWIHLPPLVRRAVEQRLGGRVVDAEPQGGGFTPGFASILTTADGARTFVKAASVKAQRPFAESYRDESVVLADLPAAAPAPGLAWAEEVEEWFVLATEHVESRAPHRPWTDADLAAASAMALTAAEVLTPAPAAYATTAEQEFGGWPALWTRLEHPHAVELADLTAGYADVVAGETLVHTDVRDDNILIRPDGTALLCDWNWPVRGAAWLDSLLLLIGPRGDGLDVEAHLGAHPLLADVPAEHVDVVLALVLGYFTLSASQPTPRTSPYVRTAQAWQRDVLDDWLAERRGWER